MTSRANWNELHTLVRQLHQQLLEMQEPLRALNLPELQSREWYCLLEEKLLPQMTEHQALIVAVVGGTNIGKSVVFNHLSGEHVSAISPLATGTKHPTALVPTSLADKQTLQDLFAQFELVQSVDDADALETSETDYLFWRAHESGSDQLIVLDTPDIDSDAEINWERSHRIRRAADVLIAVLTQQKYNDSAVRQYFQLAAQEGKPVVVIFNQCHFPEDNAYWPTWLQTFCERTGIKPEAVFLSPHDRAAANELQLPFYEVSASGQTTQNLESIEASQTQSTSSPRNLIDEFAERRFAELKLSSLKGALTALGNPQTGIPAFLDELNSRSEEFQAAGKVLSSERMALNTSWPAVPTPIVFDAIWEWWGEKRGDWQSRIHGFYHQVNQAIYWPIKQIRNQMWGEPLDPIDHYRKQEWETILTVLDSVFDRLRWVCDLGHPILKTRLEAVLTGAHRESFLARLKAEHEQWQPAEQIQKIVSQELGDLKENQPEVFLLLRRLDTFAAAARPGISLALFATGVGPLGEAVVPTVMGPLTQAAGDVATGAVTASVGEAAVSQTTSSGASYLQMHFSNIREAFSQQRAEWFADQLRVHLLQNLPTEMEQTAMQVRAEDIAQMNANLEQLKQLLEQI